MCTVHVHRARTLSMCAGITVLHITQRHCLAHTARQGVLRGGVRGAARPESKPGAALVSSPPREPVQCAGAAGSEDRRLVYEGDRDLPLREAVRKYFLKTDAGPAVHRVAVFDSAGAIEHVISQMDVMQFVFSRERDAEWMAKSLTDMGVPPRPLRRTRPARCSLALTAPSVARASSALVAAGAGRLLGSS